MRRRWLVLASGFALCVANGAMPQVRSAIPQVGVLCPTTCSGRAIDTFRQALGELGFRAGENVALLYRAADGRIERLPQLANELAHKVDVLFTVWGTAAALAAKQASATVPIVAGAVGDPLAAGLVDSLARPGGNVTGISTLALTLESKRLELLKEIEPKIGRVAVLWDPENPYSALAYREMEAAAGPLGISLVAVRVADARDLDAALAAIVANRADALIVTGYLVLVAERARITTFAAVSGLPAIYSQEEFAEVGGLVSYGVDTAQLYARAAAQVAKILRGAQPADLPVEQPTAFRLVINLKTAHTLGLSLPPSLLARADEVIE
jgi:putative tryptophan/tyrosine transport system substrate-binding protein